MDFFDIPDLSSDIINADDLPDAEKKKKEKGQFDIPDLQEDIMPLVQDKKDLQEIPEVKADISASKYMSGEIEPYAAPSPEKPAQEQFSLAPSTEFEIPSLEKDIRSTEQAKEQPVRDVADDYGDELEKTGPWATELPTVRKFADALTPEQREKLIERHKWIYGMLSPQQQDQYFAESKKSAPYNFESAKKDVGSFIDWVGTTGKAAVDVGLDFTAAYLTEPIKALIENVPNNDRVKVAKEALDADIRNVTGAIPHTLTESYRMLKKYYGAKDFSDLAERMGDSAFHPDPVSMLPQLAGIFSLPTMIAVSRFNDPDAGGIAAIDNINTWLTKDDTAAKNHFKNRMESEAEDSANDWKARQGSEKLSPWSQWLYSPIGQGVMLEREKSLLPSPEVYAAVYGISEAEAAGRIDAIAEKNADFNSRDIAQKWNKEFDQAKQDVGGFVTGPMGMGPGGLALGAIGLAKKLGGAMEGIGLSDEAFNAYMRGKQARTIKATEDSIEKAQKPRFYESGADYIVGRQAAAADWAKGVLEKIPEGARPFLPVALKYAGLGGVGGAAGALVEPESPGIGALKGAGVLAGLAITPRVVSDLGKARRAIGGGEGGVFKTAGQAPESAWATQKLFGGKTGAVADYLTENIGPLTKAGVHLGTLNLAMGTINSDTPSELISSTMQGIMMGSGFHTLGGGFRLLHEKPMREQMEDRKKRDVEIFHAVNSASPETQQQLRRIGDFENAINRAKVNTLMMEAELQQALQSGDKKKIDEAQKAVKIARAIQKSMLRANLQTRSEYGRNFRSLYADIQALANGARSGQGRLKIEVLTRNQIFQRLKEDNDANNWGKTPEQMWEESKRPGRYSRSKGTAIINADNIMNRQTLFGESPTQALRHEGFGHGLYNIPEFRKMNQAAERLLFDQQERALNGEIIKQSKGRYSDDDLISMYMNNYLKGSDPEKIQYARDMGLWDEANNTLNREATVQYMKEEVIAELNAGNLKYGLGALKKQGGAIEQWLEHNKDRNMVASALSSLTGMGAKPIYSELLETEFSPEVVAANREALKNLSKYNARFEEATEEQSGTELPEKVLRSDSALRTRYSLNGGEYKTQMVAEVRDKNGNLVGRPLPVGDNAAEGSWVHDENTNTIQRTRGYGQLQESAAIQVPLGGKVTVKRDFVYEPDGITPIRNSDKDINTLESNRVEAIRQALETDDRFGGQGLIPVSADGESYSGILSPKQRKAIEDLPESIVPLSMKEKIFELNDALAMDDGSTFDIDYAPRLQGKKYKGRRAEIYGMIPVNWGLSKAGNFYIRSVSLGALFRKVKARKKLLPGWYEPWGGSTEAFMDEFRNTYLKNTKEGKPGWMGLDPSKPTEQTPLATLKQNKFNDMLNLANRPREITPRDPDKRKSKAGEVDTLWRSFRVDAIADMLNTPERKYPFDAKRVYENLMPREVSEGQDKQKKLTPEEREIMRNSDPLAFNDEEGSIGTVTAVRIAQKLVSPEEFKKKVQEKEFENEGMGEGVGVQGLDKAFSVEMAAREILWEKQRKINLMPREVSEDLSATQKPKYQTSERGFYSGLQKIVDEKMPAKASPEQILAIVNNPQNAKPEEVKWSNIAGYLEGKTSVTKQEVLDYLGNEGAIKFEQIRLGARPDEVLSPEDEQRLAYLETENAKAPLGAIDDTFGSGTFTELLRLQNIRDKSTTDSLYAEQSYLENQARQAQRAGNQEKANGLWKEANHYTARAEALELKGAGMENQPLYGRGDLIIPGGENYREVVLTMPNREASFDESKVTIERRRQSATQGEFRVLYDGKELSPWYGDTGGSGEYGFNTDKEIMQIARRNYEVGDQYNKVKATGSNYTSSHYRDIPNYVAHMRLNDRVDSKGQKGTFIEELQSDRHQQGREKGYAGELPAGYTVEANPDPTDLINNGSALFFVKDANGKTVAWGDTKQEAQKMFTSRNGGIPDAPFRKDWPVQMFKRALQDAISSGHKWIGWTTGKAQADRYNKVIASNLDEVEVTKDPDGQSYYVTGRKNGKDIQETGAIDERKLVDTIGKDMASKAIASSDATTTFKGKDLTIGGKGMQGFYDNQIVNEIGKYIKKFDKSAVVIQDTIGTPKEGTGKLTREETAEVRKSAKALIKGDISVEEFNEEWGTELFFDDIPGNDPYRMTEVVNELVDVVREAKKDQAGGQFKAWKVEITPEMAESIQRSGQTAFMPREVEERITEATYTNPRTGQVSRGATHLIANPNAPKESTDRESPAYGFATTAGRIVDRNEAFRIAQESGQLKTPTTPDEQFNVDRGVLHSGMYEGAKQPDTSFMPREGKLKPVPTQEELDAMKQKLPEYTTEVNGMSGGSFVIQLFDKYGKEAGSAEGYHHSDDGYLEIEDTAVRDDLIGKYYGEALYREIAKYAQSLGAKTIYGETVSPQARKVRRKLFDTETKFKGWGFQSAESTIQRDISYMPREVAEIDEQKSPMPMSALNVLHSNSDVLPKPEKKVANAKVAVQLADIATQYHGRVITSNDITPQEEQAFIKNGADEAEAALKSSGKNAGNWYSTAMKAAVAVAGVLHKVISDPKEAMKNPHFAKEPDPTKAAQFAFLIPLAITSQNQTVPLNTRYGEEQFNHFQKTGKFDPSKKYGEKAASISGNLELANHMIDVMGGVTKLENFIKQEFTVKELEDAASKIAGKKITIAGRKTDMVNGAAIFGPKIGQGFLQNLMGKFDPVTIDLWMRRTWGRWTGDVVGDGVTGVRLGRLIQEYRNSGRKLPDNLKTLRTVMRSTGTTKTGKPTKPEMTISENVEERIENDPEFRKSIEQLSKDANAEFQSYYKLMGSPVSDATMVEISKVAPAGKTKYSEETREQRESAYNKLIKEQQKIKSALESKWDELSAAQKKALNTEDPTKAISKAKWIDQQHEKAGRTKVLSNEQKNAIKPQWAAAAKSIVADLNPIDIPTDQDRVVISRVVNGIRKELENRGYNVTNADVQAILWYPEKDLWAKLRGEEESNLKQSYDDELLKIAEQRGVGAEARSVAKRIRGY